MFEKFAITDEKDEGIKATFKYTLSLERLYYNKGLQNINFF